MIIWSSYYSSSTLLADGEYFSQEQMRMREPLLYEQYIGQFLTDEEVTRIFLNRQYLCVCVCSFHEASQNLLALIYVPGFGALPRGHAGRCAGGTRRRQLLWARQSPPQLLPGAAHPEPPAGGAGQRRRRPRGGRR